MECCRCGRKTAPTFVAPSRSIALLAGAIALATAYWLGGDLLRKFLEGMQRTTLPYWKGLVPVAFAAVALGAWWLRRPLASCPQCAAIRFPWRQVGAEPAGAALAVDRRVFVRRLVAAGGAAAGVLVAALARNRDWVEVFGRVILAPAPTRAEVAAPQWSEARVRAYRRLGRTDLRVSDISFGCARLDDAALVRRAIERGINYFDTSPDYSQHGSEQALGAAIRGRRGDVVVATKFCSAHGHLPNETPVGDLVASVEGSLQRLGTDYVDLIHIHSCDRVDRLLAPNVHEAFDRLREQGKVRFLGVSSHAPNLETVANAAIDSGRFDVMMLAYHFGMWPNYQQILERAHAADVGVVAMKTLKGARHAQFDDFAHADASYPQAAFRWVLANPAVSCLVVTINDPAQVDEYLFASGQQPRRADVALLERYDSLVAGDYCQPHCGKCLSVCPAGLPIDDVLRARMYERDYGWHQESRRVFAPLQASVSACEGCPAPCAAVCPQGIDIRAKVIETRALLGKA